MLHRQAPRSTNSSRAVWISASLLPNACAISASGSGNHPPWLITCANPPSPLDSGYYWATIPVTESSIPVTESIVPVMPKTGPTSLPELMAHLLPESVAH
jgi:hypothetical protein